MDRIVFRPEEIEMAVDIGKTKALRRIAAQVVRRAKALCPVGEEIRGPYERGKDAGQPWTAREPGTLRKSIRYRVTKKRVKGVRKAQVIAGNKYAYYAVWVHWGTRRHIGQPFLSQALESARGEIEIAFEGAMQ